MLVGGTLRRPQGRVDRRVAFGDGSEGRVFRETVRTGPPAASPAYLAVSFRLRVIGTSRVGHALFRAESIVNTVLFAGFPGFRSKLWLTDEVHGTYRGLYDWDGPELAARYAATLATLLRVVCVPETVAYHVVAGVRRDDVLDDPSRLEEYGAATAWWRPVPQP
ncbi:YdhR family protein [Nitriliruptoraceae bacterium ZYF776]|nr:YdhR family protein [Profundirhabdus halotolerans]